MTVPDAFGITRLFIAPTSLPTPSTLSESWFGGVMTMWDPVSFANTVVVGPNKFTNLPVVSPNGLTLGTVLLANVPGGYVVVGMLGSAKTTSLLDPVRYRALRSDVSSTTNTLIDAGTLNFLVGTDTQYAIDGCLFYNATSASHIQCAWSGPPNMQVKWSNWGTQNSAATHLLFDTVSGYGDANPQTTYGWGHSAIMHPKGWFATSDTPGLLQLRFSQVTTNASPATVQKGSWLRITEIDRASGSTTYTKLYPCTGSRSYNSSGAFIGSSDGDNNMYVGNSDSRSFGSERHMWLFNAAQVRTDLTGASLLNAAMYLYCFRCDKSQGDYNWFWSTASTVQTSFPSGGFGGQFKSKLWTPSNWTGFDVTTQFAKVLTGGANSVLGGPAGLGDAPTGFRGFGTAGYAPYFQVTYAL